MNLLILIVITAGQACASLPTPFDAVHAASEDAASLVEQGYDTTGIRYLWVPSASPEYAALASFVCNSVVSRSDINHPPFKSRSPLQKLHEGCLLRVDLVTFAPRVDDFTEITAAWEKIKNPCFLITNQVLGETKLIDGTLHRIQQVEPFQQAGKTYNKRWVPVSEDLEQRIFGPHVDALEAATLVELTQSSNPIVWVISFLEAALTQVDGGLYYEFVGINESTDPDVSDQELLLKSLGVSEELITDLRAEQRVGMVTSGVTGKTRRIDLFTAPSRAAVCQGLIVITQDIFDESANETASDVFLNLLDFQIDGTEGIFERKNGHLAYWLADGTGNLVDEAPPNLVSDHEIPAPYTRRLQPAISCIRCHGKKGDDGWKPFGNDVRKLIDQFDVLADASGDDLLETLARLAELYAGSLDKPMRRAREDQSDAIVVAVGDIANADGLQWQYEDVATSLAQVWTDHFFSPVSTRRALEELGYEPTENPQLRFNELLGTLSDGTEDVRIALLKMGTPINRNQWEAVYIDASLRARENNLGDSL